MKTSEYQDKLKQKFLKAREDFFIKNQINEFNEEDANDLLLGPEDANSDYIIKINTQVLYENWVPSQKDEKNLSEDRVKYYYDKIENKEKIRPIILQEIVENNEKNYIRTLDGRHRLSACNRIGVEEIYVMISIQLKQKLEKAFPELFIKYISKNQF